MKFLKMMDFIYWASPLIKLLTDTAGAVSDGYDESLIIDPGHKTIKILDKIIISVTWITASIIIFSSFRYYNKLDNDELTTFLIIFFPYFSNLYITILLYLNSIILFVYHKNRQNIIRKINIKKGVW